MQARQRGEVAGERTGQAWQRERAGHTWQRKSEQGRLGNEQGRLGNEQGRLGNEQGRLGNEQGRLGRGLAPYRKKEKLGS